MSLLTAIGEILRIGNLAGENGVGNGLLHHQRSQHPYGIDIRLDASIGKGNSIDGVAVGHSEDRAYTTGHAGRSDIGHFLKIGHAEAGIGEDGSNGNNTGTVLPL